MIIAPFLSNLNIKEGNNFKDNLFGLREKCHVQIECQKLTLDNWKMKKVQVSITYRFSLYECALSK